MTHPWAIEIFTGSPLSFDPQPLYNTSLKELSDVRSEGYAIRTCSKEQMGNSAGRS